jgi:hypothetical protein
VARQLYLVRAAYAHAHPPLHGLTAWPMGR